MLSDTVVKEVGEIERGGGTAMVVTSILPVGVGGSAWVKSRYIRLVVVLEIDMEGR